jgi:hypothetical protein|eukprot:SAG25_NODE_574_length_6809_cov_44.177943_4_plen_62_part_00
MRKPSSNWMSRRPELCGRNGSSSSIASVESRPSHHCNLAHAVAQRASLPAAPCGFVAITKS